MNLTEDKVENSLNLLAQGKGFLEQDAKSTDLKMDNWKLEPYEDEKLLYHKGQIIQTK